MQKYMSLFAVLALSVLSQGALAAAERVTICHKDVKTASVAASALSAHQQHGDTEGACGDDSSSAETVAAVVMMRCEAQLDSSVLVVSASSSPAPAIGMDIVPGESDCAVVLGALIDGDYGLRSVTNGTAEDGGILHLYTDYLLLGKAPAAE
jgi:hypothetical protein